MLTYRPVRSTGKEIIREKWGPPVGQVAPAPPAAPARSGRGGDVEDLVAQHAHRHLDLRDVPLLFAEEALADRAVGQDLVVVVIFLAGPNQLIRFFLVAVQVLDADAHAEDDA